MADDEALNALANAGAGDEIPSQFFTYTEVGMLLKMVRFLAKRVIALEKKVADETREG